MKKKKKKRLEEAWSRPALTMGVERKNERGGEQELREKSRARMRKRKVKILGI